jgi:hypothetical protein
MAARSNYKPRDVEQRKTKLTRRCERMPKDWHKKEYFIFTIFMTKFDYRRNLDEVLARDGIQAAISYNH